MFECNIRSTSAPPGRPRLWVEALSEWEWRWLVSSHWSWDREEDRDREKTGSGERSEQEGREHFGLVCCCGRRIFITSPKILVDKRCSEINWNKRVRIYILYLCAFQWKNLIFNCKFKTIKNVVIEKPLEKTGCSVCCSDTNIKWKVWRQKKKSRIVYELETTEENASEKLRLKYNH